jgi:hypothetical protein
MRGKDSLVCLGVFRKISAILRNEKFKNIF